MAAMNRLTLIVSVAAMLAVSTPALADYWLGGQYFRGFRGRVLVPGPAGIMFPGVMGPIPTPVPSALQPPVPGPPPPYAVPMWTPLPVPPVPLVGPPPGPGIPPDVESALMEYCATNYQAPVCRRLGLK